MKKKGVDYQVHPDSDATRDVIRAARAIAESNPHAAIGECIMDAASRQVKSWRRARRKRFQALVDSAAELCGIDLDDPYVSTLGDRDLARRLHVAAIGGTPVDETPNALAIQRFTAVLDGKNEVAAHEGRGKG